MATHESDSDFPHFNNDKYIVQRRLGAGAFGQVFAAIDSGLARLVAIKKLQAVVNHRKNAERRFDREAEVLAQLKHPSIPSMYGIETSVEGDRCVIMELVAGANIQDRLKVSIISVAESLEIGHQIALALAYAHDMQCVHRDVKPANIVVDGSYGRAVLVDWGLVRADSITVKDPDETALTTIGHRIGSPNYMSPEQANGDPATSKSDVFSLGCVLYEMLTRRLPYPGSGMEKAAFATPPEYGYLPDELPTRAMGAIGDALIVNKELRSITAHDLANALREAKGELTPSAVAISSLALASGKLAHPALLDRSDVIAFKCPTRDEPKSDTDLVRAKSADAYKGATVHLIPFTSTYHHEVVHEVRDERVHHCNKHFLVRLYLPRLKPTTPLFSRAVIMFNGLAESSSKIFDEVGWQLASDGVPSILLPLPRHLSRFVQLEKHADPFRPGSDYEKLYSQQVLQSVYKHPETICNGWLQLSNDAMTLYERICGRSPSTDFDGLFDSNAKVSLMGYSIGGLYALAIMVEQLASLQRRFATGVKIPSNLSADQRTAILERLPFSSVFLLESGLPIDQIDTSKLYFRHSGLSKILGDAYVYGPTASANRRFADDQVEKLYSEREIRRGKMREFEEEVWRAASGDIAEADKKSLFDRDLEEAERVWEEVVLQLHEEADGLGQEGKTTFRRVFLGENPILYRSQLEFLSRRILVITGGADEIFPAEKILSGPTRELATIQFPGLSHWLKGRSTLDHWQYWRGLLVELMKDFEANAVSGDE